MPWEELRRLRRIFAAEVEICWRNAVQISHSGNDFRAQALRSATLDVAQPLLRPAEMVCHLLLKQSGRLSRLF